MVKEIERAGIPVVHICTVTPISMTVGANRIVPAIAIPHPLGNPALDQEEEKKCANEIHEQEEISADIRSRRTDIVLGLLSLLAIFSALVDSTDVINEWCSKDDKVTLLWPHFLSYGIIGIVTLVVVCFLIHSYLQYRKIKNKNKDKRRK